MNTQVSLLSQRVEYINDDRDNFPHPIDKLLESSPINGGMEFPKTFNLKFQKGKYPHLGGNLLDI